MVLKKARVRKTDVDLCKWPVHMPKLDNSFQCLVKTWACSFEANSNGTWISCIVCVKAETAEEGNSGEK